MNVDLCLIFAPVALFVVLFVLMKPMVSVLRYFRPKIERVTVTGTIIASTVHKTGGYGTAVLMLKFSQRGLGGYKDGDVVSVDLDIVQEDHPQEWKITEWK